MGIDCYEAAVKFKNIMWRDDKHFKGYVIRVMWKNKSACFYLSLRQCRSENWNPLKTAISIRNEMEKEFGKPRTERKITSNIFTQGITEGWKACTRDGKKKTRHFFVTACRNPRKLSRMSVSIDKWGEQKALAKAMKIRERMVEEYFRGRNHETN